MKRTLTALLAFAAVFVGVSEAYSGREKSIAGSGVIVYYFHGTYRCYTCNNMESYSKEAVEKGFKKEIASGSLEFRPVNVEEKGNEHFIKDYGLYTKALILSRVKEGKEVKFKNLDKIWQLARNKKEYLKYVTGEVRAFIKETK